MLSYKNFVKIVLLFLFFPAILFGQDKADYQTPEGKQLFYSEVKDANGMVLSMNQIASPSKGKDGIGVVFILETDFTKINEPLKLLSFSYNNNSFMEIYYDNSTLAFKRRIKAGADEGYYYKLFDPLFDIDLGVSTKIISVFFTSTFFWIETSGPVITVPDRRHSAVFFGINLPQNDFMSRFLAQDAQAKILFGDPNSPIVFTMPGEIKLFEFNLKDLVNELQTNFCDNN